MWKCPKCEEEITYLKYEVNTAGWESGNASLSDENQTSHTERITDWDCYDSGGGEWTSDCIHNCPECEEEIDPRNLIWEEETTTPETPITPPPPEDPEESQHKIISPSEDIISDETTEIIDTGIICKKCKHHFPLDEDDDEADCPQCGTPNTTVEFKQLLGEGYYNTNNT